MTFKTRLSVLLLSTPVLAFVVVGGLLGHTSARADNDSPYPNLRVFAEVFNLVKQNYVEEVKVDRVMEGAMRGLAEGLDPDSAYLNAKQTRDLESGAALPDGDVGLELTRQFYLRVIAARDGSPAAKAGLQTGDFIRGIDGKATRDMSVFEGTRMLRGQPGSKVTLLMIRGNAAEPHELTVTRDRLTGPELTSRMANATTGYVRIVDFTANSQARIKQAVEALAKTGATRYVIDLRGTSRGDLDTGVEAARLFVRNGTLTVKVSRDPAAKADAKDKTRKDLINAQGNDGAVTAPVVLLVDSGTSGAAELFAAALDGNKRADLVGERTIGRAARQQLVKLPDGSGLLLTTVRYLSPASVAIHEKGLTPDVHVPEPDVDFGADPPAGDAALEKAIERLTQPQKQAA